jgi:hypothetical protein
MSPSDDSHAASVNKFLGHTNRFFELFLPHGKR